jgi:hypothetical protein
VEAAFDGGEVTSDAGGVLLREVEKRRRIIERFARCFKDFRDPDLVEHTVHDLVAQRVYGLALGYEDLNDHETLRRDPLLATLVGKEEPDGRDRRRARDKGKALAGKSTLNRLELAPADADGSSRYKKVVYDGRAIEDLLVGVFLDAYQAPPEPIILDLDATDDPVHGSQEGRFFHGYYGHYCFLPLYIFAGDHLLCAKLRPANIDGAAGSLEEVQRIVGRLRERWPGVKIIVRGDSGFARDYLMTWCEANGVDYVLGLARNDRLIAEVAEQMRHAKARHAVTGKSTRSFRNFQYRTHKTWTRARRVVGKAECLPGKENPRFVVTSLPRSEAPTRWLYERLYCARGDMENRIKEQQLDLFADRTSAHTLRANQLRLWFSSVAYVLVAELRRLGLQGTEMEHAQAGTIRTRLLKIGALVRISVRRIKLAMSSGCPFQTLFWTVLQNLQYRYPMVT